MHSTDRGVRFGTLPAEKVKPAPTLFVLASAADSTLRDEYFLQCGATLRGEGYLCVSLDLPCHGDDQRPDEPTELSGWRHRLEAGEDLVGDFAVRATQVLDHLIAAGEADPKQVAVCGTSRGGFMALHWAARDDRVQCVVVMAPITELGVLHEFQAMLHPKRAESSSANTLVDRLFNRPIWIAVGDRDLRIGTDETIAFARRLSAAAEAKKSSSQVDLLVLAEPRGHSTPPGAAAQSAVWVSKQLAGGDR